MGGCGEDDNKSQCRTEIEEKLYMEKNIINQLKQEPRCLLWHIILTEVFGTSCSMGAERGDTALGQVSVVCLCSWMQEGGATHLAAPMAGNERLGREHCMRQCSRVRPQQGPRMKYRQSGGKHGNRSFAQDAILTSLNSRRRTQFHQTSQTGFIFFLLVHSPGISECWWGGRSTARHWRFRMDQNAAA